MEGAEKVLKNIIFDLGGVLLNIDMDKTSEAFVLLGWKDSEGRDISQAGYPVFEKLEVGKDTPEQFRENVRKILPGKATDEDIDRAWNAMLIDFPPSIIDYINHLKSKYRLFLLSNTNAIHLLRFRDVFYNSFGYSIDDLFVKTYYSHELGFRKPHPGAYQTLLQDASILPEETLFVDDLKINTESAAALGMQVLHIEAGKLMQYLPEKLLQSYD